jgi:adenylate cyclase
VYPFPVLEELSRLGVTDYVACVHRLGEPANIGELDCVFSSWATDALCGFGERGVALIEALGPFLAAAISAATVRQIARTLADTPSIPRW